jgi:hypothetical protein
MDVRLQITFRNLAPSPIVEEWIGVEAAKLETFYRRPMACRVAVEVPHRHHKNGSPYHIRIDLSVPGGELVVTRQPDVRKRLWQKGELHVRKYFEIQRDDRKLHLAIHEAFRAAGRALARYAQRQRGEVKTHRFGLERTRKALGMGVEKFRMRGRF